MKSICIVMFSIVFALNTIICLRLYTFEEKKDTTISFKVNDSLLYEAKFRLSEIDSVKNGLKEYATPLQEKYITK